MCVRRYLAGRVTRPPLPPPPRAPARRAPGPRAGAARRDSPRPARGAREPRHRVWGYMCTLHRETARARENFLSRRGRRQRGLTPPQKIPKRSYKTKTHRALATDPVTIVVCIYL